MRFGRGERTDGLGRGAVVGWGEREDRMGLGERMALEARAVRGRGCWRNGWTSSGDDDVFGEPNANDYELLSPNRNKEVEQFGPWKTMKSSYNLAKPAQH